MNKLLLSVTFIDEDNNRKWSYDNVFKMETGVDTVMVWCSEIDCNRVYASQRSEFTKIEFEVQERYL